MKKKFGWLEKTMAISVISLSVLVGLVYLITFIVRVSSVQNQYTLKDNAHDEVTIQVDTEPTPNTWFTSTRDITFKLSDHTWKVKPYPLNNQNYPETAYAHLIAPDGTLFLIAVVLDKDGGLAQFTVNKCRDNICPY